MALHAGDIEVLGPSLQNPTPDRLLIHREREREGQRQRALDLIFAIVFVDKSIQAIGHKVPKLLSRAGLDLGRQLELALGLFKVSFSFSQTHIAHAEVGATHVDGEDPPSLVAGRVAHDPADNHGLFGSQ